jgi:hypothetical protein
MPRTALPKMYLRIDPNLDRAKADTRWDFIRLLCEANRQTRRGRFKSRALFDGLLGRAAARRLIEAGDAVERASGEVVVPGWEEWQEGDITVAERQRRIRARRDEQRDNGVTSPLLDRIQTPLSSTTRSSPDEGVGRGASANGADGPSPVEIALHSLLAPRTATPNQVSLVEDLDHELGGGLVLATIENLLDERPERNAFGALKAQLLEQKAAMRPQRNGHAIGPPRNRANDYDALTDGPP